MNKSVFNKPIFAKRNYPIYFGFLLLTLINFIYVSLEIQRPNILKSIGYDSTVSSVYRVTQTDVEQITAIANRSLLFETAFIILSIVCILLLLTKRFRPFFTGLMMMAFSLLSMFFILNVALAMLFDVPPGNLTQLLLIPFQFAIGAFIYGYLKVRKRTQPNSELKR